MASAVRTVCSDCAAASLCGLDMLNTMDQVADIQSRVLLMQGSEDCVTPLSNAATMMSVMEEAGVRATLLPIEGQQMDIKNAGKISLSPISLNSLILSHLLVTTKDVNLHRSLNKIVKDKRNLEEV